MAKAKQTREQRQTSILKIRKEIWEFMKIGQAVKQYGYLTVKQALNSWVNLERSRTNLEKQKEALEAELAEIKKKI